MGSCCTKMFGEPVVGDSAVNITSPVFPYFDEDDANSQSHSNEFFKKLIGECESNKYLGGRIIGWEYAALATSKYAKEVEKMAELLDVSFARVKKEEDFIRDPMKSLWKEYSKSKGMITSDLLNITKCAME